MDWSAVMTSAQSASRSRMAARSASTMSAKSWPAENTGPSPASSSPRASLSQTSRTAASSWRMCSSESALRRSGMSMVTRANSPARSRRTSVRSRDSVVVLQAYAGEVAGGGRPQELRAAAQVVHADRHGRALAVLDADPPGEAGARETREDAVVVVVALADHAVLELPRAEPAVGRVHRGHARQYAREQRVLVLAGDD